MDTFTTIVILLVAVHHCYGACVFPTSLQDAVKWYNRKVRSSMSFDPGMYGLEVTFSADKMTAINTAYEKSYIKSTWPYNSADFRPYVRICEELVSGNNTRYVDDQLYLVSEITDGVSSGFKCLKFHNKSNDIVQVSLSESMHERPITPSSVCNDSALRSDPWLYVRHFKRFESIISDQTMRCPPSGGYEVILASDAVYKKGLHSDSETCVNLALDIQCLPGEISSIDFRDESCVLTGIPISYKSYSLLPCIASWDEGEYSFLVMKEDTLNRALLTLRSRNISRDEVEAILIKGVILDTTPTLTAASAVPADFYVKMTLKRRTITTLCEDDKKECFGGHCSTSLSGARFGNRCLKSCNYCNSTSNAVSTSCSFSELYQGTWKNADNQEVQVNETEISIPGYGSLKCIGFKKLRSLDGIVVFATFDNGCRPRYKCLNLTRSGNTLQWRIGLGYEPWPGYGPTLPTHYTVCSENLLKYTPWQALTPVNIRTVISQTIRPGFTGTLILICIWLSTFWF